MSEPSILYLPALAGGPAKGGALCRLDDIEDGGALNFSFGEGAAGTAIFLLRRGTAVYGYLNVCPHAGSPLDWIPGKFLNATGTMIQCATHGARFRIEDGFCERGPCPGSSLTPVALAVEDGHVVALGEATASGGPGEPEIALGREAGSP